MNRCNPINEIFQGPFVTQLRWTSAGDSVSDSGLSLTVARGSMKS